MENFEIISKLGSGGFSKVYKVKRIIDNQIYALKKSTNIKFITLFLNVEFYYVLIPYL